jgi:hypothetical protein
MSVENKTHRRLKPCRGEIKLTLGGFLAVYEGIFEDVALIIAGIFGTLLIFR